MYKIIGDSCLDLNEEEAKDPHFFRVPLTIQIDEYHILDDQHFDQADMLKKMADSPHCPKSACPSPEAYLSAYEAAEADMIFVITLSHNLSGSFNSARLAKELYDEKSANKGKVYVFSSESASSGETALAFFIRDLAEKGENFDTIVYKAQAFRDHMKTYFVLETLETLRKNGRLTGLQAFVASALNIKPVMGAHKGNIVKLDQARGTQKALQKMISLIVQEAGAAEEKRLVIAHCNCPERAKYVRDELLRKVKVKEVYITNTAGISTMYANDGGVIIAI